MTRALPVVDLQKDSLVGGSDLVVVIERVTANVDRLADAFRDRGSPVYTQHTHRPGGSDLPRGEPVDAIGAPLPYREGSEGWEIIDEVRPRPGDVVVGKLQNPCRWGTPGPGSASARLGPTIPGRPRAERPGPDSGVKPFALRP